MHPLFVPKYVKQHLKSYPEVLNEIPKIKEKLKKFRPENPIVSIAIPAYNEEENILQTLSSLASNITQYPTEIIVINNNSSDSTQELLDKVGVLSLTESKQGIRFARNCGLYNAKGVYHLNADADSIYPPNWIDTMVSQLENEDITCVYGKHSLIPIHGNNRLLYFIFEIFANIAAKKRIKYEEAVNVYGFNFGFRRKQAIELGGFEHPPETKEDGWMALRLKKLGKLQLIDNDGARVWTSDRRLIIDGGLFKGSLKRLQRAFTIWKITSKKD